MRPTGPVLLLLSLALTACSGDDPRPLAAPSPTGPPPITPSVAASAAPSVATSPPAPSGTALPPAPAELPATETTYFLSPTGNLLCGIGSDVAGCAIGGSTFTPPPKPADCEFDWGKDVSVGTSGVAQFDCVSDTALGSERFVLAYGSRTTNGRFTCSSDRATGISCATVDGAHGFQLSRERYRVF